MMLHLSVGWTVFDVINQRVASESWKMNSKVRGDRWRSAKNPSMAKLVSLWFLMSRHPQNNHLPSCKSTVSTETVITVFDTVSFGLIDLTVVGNGSHQFYWLRSGVWCPMSNSSVDYTICSGRDYLKSRPTCFAQDEISLSWLSRANVIDQDDPSWMSLELDFL